ncbi:mitochondrial 54S ribosomal protein mL58 ASCRUDRAFT_9528 [Ascoidea rubescens DSM 1968]|uniref:Uncharacterized protein n=1 Tax=Ascoidea rubescens DSM 1968 TaxID=1344418 RepID=A0A1D2VD18_9ASCO|nr:hypothetical protein ASCRUDRAFT_9528 [Ascoidea rubescens DSM 1968]ODV59489.1 hypothetical protein ASCRUDRAFT_9528 [Ascoidea rubescens DSM 1968]
MAPGLYRIPAPSIPSPLDLTPNAFLPKNDPRYTEESAYTLEDINNMPVIGDHSEKKYNLNQKQIKEIIKLNSKDPNKYTRKVLAEKFNCSPFFVGLVSRNTVGNKRYREMMKRLNYIRDHWGKKKKINAEIHQKLKKYVYSDE